MRAQIGLYQKKGSGPYPLGTLPLDAHLSIHVTLNSKFITQQTNKTKDEKPVSQSNN